MRCLGYCKGLTANVGRGFTRTGASRTRRNRTAPAGMPHAMSYVTGPSRTPPGVGRARGIQRTGSPPRARPRRLDCAVTPVGPRPRKWSLIMLGDRRTRWRRPASANRSARHEGGDAQQSGHDDDAAPGSSRRASRTSLPGGHIGGVRSGRAARCWRGAPRPRPKGRPSARRPRTRARTCRRRPRSRRRAPRARRRARSRSAARRPRARARAARSRSRTWRARVRERVERLVAEELERREREPRDHVGADEGRGRPRLHRLGDAARDEPARRREREARDLGRARAHRARRAARAERGDRGDARAERVAREHEPEALARARGRLRLGGRRRDARDAEQPPQHGPTRRAPRSWSRPRAGCRRARARARRRPRRPRRRAARPRRARR